MDYELIYPKLKRQSIFMMYFRYICGVVFVIAALVCPVVNICVGGKAWSVIAVWGIYMMWTLLLKQPLVERNLISQGVRLLVTTVIMLVLIDWLIYPGWAAFVVPIVCYGALIVLAVLFLVNVSKQRHNVMPLLILSAIVVAGTVVAMVFFSERRWPMIALSVTAATLLAVAAFILRMRLITEIRKRFHIR